MTDANHSSSNWQDGKIVYTGEPTGIVVRQDDGPTIYFAGDTNVFGDMALIRRLYAPDVAVLPIGDHYTMGPEEAALAAELLGAARVRAVPLRHVRPADGHARRAAAAPAFRRGAGRPGAGREPDPLAISHRAPDAGPAGAGGRRQPSAGDERARRAPTPATRDGREGRSLRRRSSPASTCGSARSRPRSRSATSRRVGNLTSATYVPPHPRAWRRTSGDPRLSSLIRTAGCRPSSGVTPCWRIVSVGVQVPPASVPAGSELSWTVAKPPAAAARGTAGRRAPARAAVVSSTPPWSALVHRPAARPVPSGRPAPVPSSP